MIESKEIRASHFVTALDGGDSMITQGDLWNASRESTHSVVRRGDLNHAENAWETLRGMLNGEPLIVIAGAAATDAILDIATNSSANWLLKPGSCACFEMNEYGHLVGDIETLLPIEHAN
ncbi:MAG TPA: hypothetical protein DEP63_04540 [Candidatus Magasanikbacteria bacterium]|nr:hypothetical protein [Candidatus Magasanikbacteria bacterium]